MIDFYNPDFEGTHVIRVTLMQWEYVGHIAFKIGGNCKGASLLYYSFLDCNTQEDIARYTENDCHFSFNEEYEIYRVILKNANEDELLVEGDVKEISDMIVGIEIVEVIPEG